MLQRQITKRERITITKGRHQYLGLFLMAFSFFVTIYFLYDLFTSGGFNLSNFILTTSSFLVLLLVFKFSLKLADVAINRDVLFMNQLFAPCRVISLEDIDDVKTFQVLWFTVTTLRYTAKSKSQKIIFLKFIKKADWCPEEIIKFVCNPV